MKLFIPIILGTTRPQRESEKPARYLLSLIEREYSSEIETVLVDPVELDFKLDGKDLENKDPRYSELTKRADGFLIVTPEYNHSIPGSLKRLLDAEYENYNKKAVAIVGVSDGPWGGVRAIEALLHVTKALGLVNIKPDLQFARVKELFDEKNELLNSAIEPRATKLIEELLWMTKVLKWGRENLK